MGGVTIRELFIIIKLILNKTKQRYEVSHSDHAADTPTPHQSVLKYGGSEETNSTNSVTD